VLQRPLEFAGKRAVPCSWQNRLRSGPFHLAADTNIAQSLHRNAGPATLIQAPEQPRPVHDDHHPRHGLGRVAKNPAQRCFEMFRSRVPSPLLGSAVHGCCSVESARRFGLGEHLDLVATSTRASVLYFAKFLINNIQIHT
jgi:hypothetical protein